MQQPCELIIENVTITLKNGDITKEDVDALVNLTNSSLNQKFGVAKAILEAGGAPLEEECHRLSKQVHGDVVVTGGGNIKVKGIVHIIEANNLCKIADMVKKALEETAKMNLNSVAFPAIGTGAAGFSPQESLKSILKGIREFLLGTPSSIQRITIVAFMTNVFQEYLQIMKTEIAKNLSLSLTLNGTIVELVKGNITKQPVDCILNLTNSTMDCPNGVSGAICSAAGSKVADECAEMEPLTSGGNLNSKHIMHVINLTSVPAFASSLENFLTECKAEAFKTLALPTFGTGTFGLNPAISIDAILDGIERCLANMNVAEFTKILINTCDENVYSDCLKAFQARQELRLTINGTIVELVKGDITKQLVDCVVNLTNATLDRYFGVCRAILSAAGKTVVGECKRIGKITNGQVAITTGGNLESKNILHVIGPTSVSEFDSSMETILTECAAKAFKTVALPAIGTGGAGINKSRSINAVLDGIEGCLSKMNASAFTKISIIAYNKGVYNDFLKVFQARQPKETQSMDTNLQQSQGRDICKNVNLDSISSELIPYKSQMAKQTANGFLQGIFNWFAKFSSENQKSNAACIPANYPNFQITFENLIGRTVETIYENLPEPENWSPMKGQLHQEVEMHKDSDEFKSVADKFSKLTNQTYQISKIKRIQNTNLWKKYSFNKFIIDQQYPDQENEKQLYHGTDYKTAEKINLHGFNRAFCGKNATAYGKGTYFATNASYSCDDKYSVKDENGEKHVYQAAVITGKWCLGDKSYLEPPPTPEDPKTLYNSTVDNGTNPTIFVVYLDYYAYPKYLISFTSSG